MTFLIDDLLVRPFMGLLEILHDLSIREQYDEEAIRDALKENRLLYEVGNRSESEYERQKETLEAELEAAQQAKEQLRGRAEVLR